MKQFIGYALLAVAYIALFWWLPFQQLGYREGFFGSMKVHAVVLAAAIFSFIIAWCFVGDFS